MEKNKIILLKNGTDVFGKKIEILSPSLSVNFTASSILL